MVQGSLQALSRSSEDSVMAVDGRRICVGPMSPVMTPKSIVWLARRQHLWRRQWSTSVSIQRSRYLNMGAVTHSILKTLIAALEERILESDENSCKRRYGSSGDDVVR